MVHKEKRLCKCGCGKEIIIMSHHKYYGIPDYIRGHNTRINNPMNNSEIAKKSAFKRTGTKRSDETKRLKSKQMIEYHKLHPEMGKNQSKMMSGDGAPMKNLNFAKKQSESMKNSIAAKNNSKNQIGGQDLVRHHYIYDHNDLNKYTTLMTRSKHAKLHANMRKANIKIPHINKVK